MLASLIHKPIGMMMTMVAILVLAIATMPHIPISLLPDIQIPRITVSISAPNLDIRTLENTVITPIRTQLMQVQHLADIQSETRNGNGTIHLTLEHGTSTDLSYIEINEKIDLLQSMLPRDLERPRVIKSNVSDIPVMEMVMYARDNTSSDKLNLSQFAKNIIQRRIKSLREIAFVDLHGYVEPQIIISPKRALTETLRLTDDKIITSIQDANLRLGNVILQDGSYQYNVDLQSTIHDMQAVQDIKVEIDGNVFTLSEIANISYTPKEERGSFYYNTHRAISFKIIKQAEANNFALQENLNHLVEHLQEEYPNIAFKIVDDQSSILKASYESLMTALLFGLVFAIATLLFFIRDWRLTLLIAISIPCAILTAFILFYLCGMSINIISLSGLILGIGLMIDNGIIIIDNINLHHKSTSLENAVLAGPAEVIRPLISSALTTSSVFVPMILLSGIAGALFYDQALSICISLSCSLVISYLVLPVLAYRLLASKVDAPQTNPMQWHDRMMDFIFARKWFIVLGAILIMIISILLIRQLQVSALPNMTNRFAEIKINWNEQIALTENERRTQELIHNITNLTEYSYHSTGELQYLLSYSPQHLNEAHITAAIAPSDYDSLRKKVNTFITTKYPRAIYDIQPKENAVHYILNTQDANVSVRYYSNQNTRIPDPSILQNAQAHLPIPPLALSTILMLKVRSENLLIYNVSLNVLVQKLKTLLNENWVTQIQSGNVMIPIYIGDDTNQSIQSIIDSETVSNNTGQRLPLHLFISAEPVQDYKSIRSDQSGEYYAHTLDTNNPLSEIKKIKSYVRENSQLSVKFAGQYFKNQVIIQEMKYILYIVAALLYLILAAQFESLIQPCIVLLILPLGFAGGLIGLYLGGTTINLVSMVGLMIMMGIVINDAILKIDIYNRNLTEGYSKKEAIYNASKKRLRPIIMTSLTTIFAMTPILFSSGLGAELQMPLALSVIGGLTISTWGSITILPLLMYLFPTHISKSKLTKG